MRTVTIMVEGEVQGVGFRYALQSEARRRGATGWVRNRRDGRVEALVSAPEPTVEALVAWVREGPPTARVDRVEVGDGGPVDGNGFEIRPTA